MVDGHKIPHCQPELLEQRIRHLRRTPTPAGENVMRVRLTDEYRPRETALGEAAVSQSDSGLLEAARLQFNKARRGCC